MYKKKEMKYLDGGYYLNPTKVKAVIFAVGASGVSAAAIPLITAGIYSIPGVLGAITGLEFVTREHY